MPRALDHSGTRPVRKSRKEVCYDEELEVGLKRVKVGEQEVSVKAKKHAIGVNTVKVVEQEGARKQEQEKPERSWSSPECEVKVRKLKLTQLEDSENTDKPENTLKTENTDKPEKFKYLSSVQEFQTHGYKSVANDTINDTKVENKLRENRSPQGKKQEQNKKQKDQPLEAVRWDLLTVLAEEDWLVEMLRSEPEVGYHSQGDTLYCR